MHYGIESNGDLNLFLINKQFFRAKVFTGKLSGEDRVPMYSLEQGLFYTFLHLLQFSPLSCV